jgi:hypothetical protein
MPPVRQNGLLDVFFVELAGQAEEIQEVGVAEDQIGHPVFVPQSGQILFDQLSRFLGNYCSLPR